MSAHARLISIIRRPGELVAFVSEPEPKIQGFTALDHVPQGLYPGKERLRQSWRSLAQVAEADEETLCHVLVVIIETAPDLSIAPATLPPLAPDWGKAPVRRKPTSAHPRAFHGTKYRPPKAPGLTSFDVRPYLCDAGSLRAVLSPMKRFQAKARARLAKNGYCGDAIEREFSRSASKSYWTMPARFVQYIWPLVRRRPTCDVTACLSLYRALDLESDDALLQSVSRLIALSESAHPWCALANVLPVPRRLPFVQALLESKPRTVPPAPTAATQLAQIGELANDAEFPLWVSHFLKNARDGISANYLLAGIRLESQLVPRCGLHTIGQCESYPEQLVKEIGIELDDERLAMGLWKTCGLFPGMAEALRQSAWRSFAREAAVRYFGFVNGLAYSDCNEPTLQERWRGLRRVLPQIEALLLDIPAPYQAKAIAYLTERLTSCRRVPLSLALIRRLAAPPFTTGYHAAPALASLLEFRDPAPLLTAPSRSFELLERACRRETNATLIGRALETLGEELPTFAMEGFIAAPRKLMRTAKILGGVSAPVGAQICRVAGEHPVFQLSPLTTPIRETCAKLMTECADKYAIPMPARLKSWYRGAIRLSAGSLKRYQAVLAQQMVLRRLDLIERSVLARLQQGLPPRPVSKNDRHALRLLGDVGRNRRGLRRFLQAYWSGNEDYLSNHPVTLSWYRKHPAISREVWGCGIPFEPEHRQFRIQMERDPLEVLKLGTYAGTCLTIGGLCSESAIAVLLDVNKRVLYARDPRGRVIARQLVAIADDDCLVCFRIYPQTASSAVKSAFLEYDRALADGLGIPLYQCGQAGDKGYSVGPVLSEAWWDDGSWDFNPAVQRPSLGQSNFRADHDYKYGR